MYYWIVKHDGSEDQDLISCREELGTFRQDYVVVESLSPLLKNASFALGRRISTDRTWRDLNDAIITHLQSQSVQDNKEQPTLGLNVGANNPVHSWTSCDLNISSRDGCGIQEHRSTEYEAIILQIPRGDILSRIITLLFFVPMALGPCWRALPIRVSQIGV